MPCGQHRLASALPKPGELLVINQTPDTDPLLLERWTARIDREPIQAIERTTPPSARTAVPLIADANGLATNATTDATSSGVAKR
jgi:hypothetical protein